MKTSKPSADTTPPNQSRTMLARHTGLMVNRTVSQRIEPSMKYWRNLERLDQFMRLVLASRLQPYWVFVDGPIRRARPIPIDTQDTGSLADYIDGFRAYADQAYEGPRSPHLTYAPHIELFFELFSSHPVAGSRGQPNSRIPGGRIQADVYNDFVDLLRRAAMDRKLSRAMHNWEANGRGNREKLDRYLDGLFAGSDSLTVMHLNVVHTTQHFNLEFTPWVEQEKFLRDLATARQIFLDRRGNHPALFEHMKGYVWSIETSLPEGFSLHLTLLFDTTGLVHTGNLNGGLDTPLALGRIPASHQPKVTFPQLVGEYIVRVATKGKGRYRVCHQDSAHYPNWPYGTIEAKDLPRRNQLAEVLGHLAMKHDMARLKNLPKGGRGQPRNPPFFGIGRLEARRSNERARQARSIRNGVSLGQNQ
jgi:hypothetical protein